MTPGATPTVVDDPVSEPPVDGDGVVCVEPSCEVAAPPVPDVDSLEFGAVELPAVAVPEVALPVVDWLLAEDESLADSGLAQATPAGVAIAVPTPRATAKAPTRPMNSTFLNVHYLTAQH